MSKQNTRLIFIKTSKDLKDLSRIIEKIDNLLAESKYFEVLSHNTYIYGSPSEDMIKVGREVVGREEDFYHHDEVEITDFDEISTAQEEKRVKTPSELFSFLDDQDKNYRVELVLGEYLLFKYSFF